MAFHGVKLSIPGLQEESEGPLPSPEPSEPGLVRLLSLLCNLELNGNLHSELKQTVERERACLLQDILLHGLLDDASLRHCLDTAMENSTPGKIKVLEVRLERIEMEKQHQLIKIRPLIASLFLQALSNDGGLFTRVVPLLNIQPMMHIDYVATATDLDLLSPHQATLEELAIASAQWDPLMGPAPGGVVGGADLVVCNHAWGPVNMDPALLVANLSSGTKQGGFVLFHTLLKGDTLGETVSFLSSTTQSSQGLLTQVSGNHVKEGINHRGG